MSQAQGVRQSATVNRRLLIAGSAALVLSRPRSVFAQATPTTAFDIALDALASDDQAIDEMRSYREFAVYFPDLGLERAPIKAIPSNTPISDEAIKLIVYCEVSSPAAYRARYSRPVWPQGQSGVTVGVGYDIGYTSPNELQDDWNAFISGEDVDRLTIACGHIGKPAESIAETLQQVNISWEAAWQQFLQKVLPRYIGLTETAVPNFDELSPKCRGAIVSLVYTRGATFNVPKHRDSAGRYDEMRAIRSLMITKDFGSIPAQIRSMQRLWADKPKMRGVVVRRELEAKLFEQGLS